MSEEIVRAEITESSQRELRQRSLSFHIEEMREAFLDLEHAEFEDQRAEARERFEAAYRAVRLAREEAA